MESARSGLYYTNKIVRAYLYALEEVLGVNGLKIVMRKAGLEAYINNFPPDNLRSGFDFADFTNLNAALEDVYGPRGGRGLALRAGRLGLLGSLKDFGALAGVSDKAFQVLPLKLKLRVGLPAMARVFSQFSDQVSHVLDEGDHYVYTLERCPMCHNRRADKPVCFAAMGVIQGGLEWVSGGRRFQIDMQSCMAVGDDMGRIIIGKEPID
jgi:hypothetical protein